jgi:hypothetical protein
MESWFDDETSARLRRVIMRLARLLNDSASAEGLTPTQASVLAVAAHGPGGLAKVAEVEGINPTMLSRVVTKLDGDGLIRRMPHPGRPARRARRGDGYGPRDERADQGGPHRGRGQARPGAPPGVGRRDPAGDAGAGGAGRARLTTYARGGH